MVSVRSRDSMVSQSVNTAYLGSFIDWKLFTFRRCSLQGDTRLSRFLRYFERHCYVSLCKDGWVVFSVHVVGTQYKDACRKIWSVSYIFPIFPACISNADLRAPQRRQRALLAALLHVYRLVAGQTSSRRHIEVDDTSCIEIDI